jgi:uncharacterized protein (DUF1697 family)
MTKVQVHLERPTRHVAFLRAINVAGHPTIRMTDLCRAFESAGCRNVRSVIQSGNVLFEADRGAEALLARVKARVRAFTRAEPVIVTRTMTELERVVRGAPFGALAGDRALKLYVVFLAASPRRRPRLPQHDEKERLELVGISGRHAFVVSHRKPGGMYGFPNQFVEDALGVAATSRNWTTVNRILNL